MVAASRLVTRRQGKRRSSPAQGLPWGAEGPAQKETCGGPARSQRSQCRSAPSPRYAGHHEGWTREVFSNKTQVIPLGGRLCSKPAYSTPHSRARGHGGAPWAVGHTSVLNYGGPSWGAGRHSVFPRCLSSHLVTLARLSFHESPGRTTGPSCCRPSTSAQFT